MTWSVLLLYLLVCAQSLETASEDTIHALGDRLVSRPSAKVTQRVRGMVSNARSAPPPHTGRAGTHSLGPDTV